MKWDGNSRVQKRTGDDFHACGVANVHHVFILRFATALGLKLVADNLVVGPPLGTLDVLIDGIHLYISVSCLAELALVVLIVGIVWPKRLPAGPMKFVHSLAIESQFH